MIIFYLKVVNLFKRLCQVVNRNCVCVMRIHIYFKKFRSWFTVSDTEWGWFFVFYHPMTSVIWKFQKLKATHWTFSRERSRKSKNIQKKYLNWLLAILAFFKHFRKNVSPYVPCSVVNMSLSLVITLSW